MPLQWTRNEEKDDAKCTTTAKMKVNGRELLRENWIGGYQSGSEPENDAEDCKCFKDSMRRKTQLKKELQKT